MPRTKLSAQSDAKAALAQRIKAEAYAQCGGVSGLCPKISMTPPTLRRRLHNVSELTLVEIKTIRSALHISREEMAELIAKVI